MDTGSQELNACAECGFTTRDWAQFARHVERHESGGGIGSRKSSKAVPTTPAVTDGSTARADGGDTDFQHLLDLALPKIEELDSSTTNCSAEDEMIIGRLADLSRFLNASHQNRSDNSSSPVDLSSDKRPKIENVEEAKEDGEKNDLKNGTEEARHKTKSRSKTNGTGGGGGGGAGKTTHKCPHCTFTTYMSQHMKSHLRAHENFIGQMYVCDVCGMAFSQKANMHRHRGTHSGVKPYECRFCQKRFFRKDQMQEHSMTHIKTGDDFDCPVAGCEFKFSQHALLRQHLDERHEISLSQQAHCKRCTLTFANSRRLLLHYQTKHDEYYNAVSPVPDGHSPVKRLVVMNNTNTINNNNGMSSASDSYANGDAAVATAKRPCSASSAPTVAAVASGCATANNAATHGTAAKRKNRKRPSARRQRSASGGGGAMYSSNMMVGTTVKRQALAAATASVAPPNHQQQQQQTSVNGYNVEELLRLNCATGANANDGKRNGIANQTMFKMSPNVSPSSPAGFDLFRDQLLRNTSLFAQQLGTVPPPFSALPMAHRSQNQVAAAAAQLFMQSFLLPSQQHQQHTHSVGHQSVLINGLSNPPAEEERGLTISPKHLPLAKSPDCRGLVLHGFISRGEEAIGCEQKLIKQEGPTRTTTTTNSSCTPPMMISNSNVHEGNVEEEGSESEAPILDAKQQSEEMGGNNSQKTTASKEHPSATSNTTTTTILAPVMPTSGPTARHGIICSSSAHSSTTHSPSSSSTSSTSSTASSSHVVIIGGAESTASSSGAANGSGVSGGASLENSPLKDLNNKLLSRALMNASVSSAGATSSDGLLLKGLLMLEPSSAGGGDMDCAHCGLMFSDQTLYLLHKGLHSEADPWRCNLCGHSCSDKYTFTTHMISSDHS